MSSSVQQRRRGIMLDDPSDFTLTSGEVYRSSKSNLGPTGKVNGAVHSLQYKRLLTPCVWYAEPTPPLLNQFICAACGHSIHSHVDYVSTTVCHNVATQCAAYVQKTPLTQRCTCSVHLADHRPILNLHRLQDPFSILDDIGALLTDGSLSGANNAPYIPSSSGSGALGHPEDAANITYSQTDMSTPSTSQSTNTTQTTENLDHREFFFRHYVPRH
ncbi:hypothetical protein IW261DRAFT_1560958 [Armillaria novae-zelandiae]|uniref:Uncharacterized protein n=1 Tax=Armillaria novae-zelandiae TaxID=153914 RepID=A0AA39PG83_9AGAR|nr:hypothetical protein IW261DRAFT_1560958 [Armillaria novae-zelandiae]